MTIPRHSAFTYRIPATGGRLLVTVLASCLLCVPLSSRAGLFTSPAPASRTTGQSDLLAATYLGGGGAEGWTYSGTIDAAVAPTGEIFVVGMTASTDFPTTPGAFQCAGCGGGDVFVARFSWDLTTLLAATVFGGNQLEVMSSVAVGSDGTVYVAGHTGSANFPATVGSYDETWDAGNDAFVARFDAGLTTLLAATYLGGNGNDLYPTLDLDPWGNPVVCGVTVNGAVNTFPTTPGAWDRTPSLSYPDFFVSRLSGDLSVLMASTLLGGRYEEAWGGAMVDPSGNIIVGGSTESDDYPSTPGAYEELFHGPPQPGQYLHDVVVSKLSIDLDSLLASTFVGTNGFDGGQEITLDGEGNVIVGGHTDATDYPVTPGALDEVHNGQNEYFLTRLDNDLTTVLASTFLTPNDAGFTFLTDLVTDADGNIYGTGPAWEANCPVTDGAFDTTFNGGANDFMLMKLSADLTTLAYATFLGGDANDGDCAVAVEGLTNVITAGYTGSANMPATIGAYDESFNGGSKDAFVARFDLDYPTPVFLAYFDVHVGDGGVDFAWSVATDATVDDFQLEALSGSERWYVPVTAVSGRRFHAIDSRPVDTSSKRAVYSLFGRAEGESWLLLHTEAVDRRVPEAGVRILGVHPNPASREASLSFSVGSIRRLTVEVFDVEGRRTARLVEDVYPVGDHTLSWSGRDAHGRRVASGVYFFRVSGAGRAGICKFVLVR